jgi:NAD+ kinase
MERVLGTGESLSLLVVGEDLDTSGVTSEFAEVGDTVTDVVEAEPGADAVQASGDADVVVTIGESALFPMVDEALQAPILPVDGGRGIESVRRADLAAAITAIAAGDGTLRSVPTVALESDGSHYCALMDAMAVTSEAAKISEYEVARRRDGGDEVLERIRADGIVAAAPAGTPGYGTAAGGPVLDPDLDAVTVVPVGPFRIEQPHWVLELPITIRVVREEVPVSLLVDDTEVGTITAGTAVELSWGSPIDVVRTPVSQSPLRGRGSGRDD